MALLISGSRSATATKNASPKALRSPPLNVFASEGSAGFLASSGVVLTRAVRGEVVDEVLHSGEVGVALGRDAELMNAAAFTLRVAFGNLSRSARLPAHIVVFAEIVLRFAHDLR